MSTTTIPRPPFDPELDAVFSVVADQLPGLTRETIAEFRSLLG